jgi:subtilisin family serine protease
MKKKRAAVGGAPKLKTDWFWPMADRLSLSEYGSITKQIRVAHIDIGISLHPCLINGFIEGNSFVNELVKVINDGGRGIISWNSVKKSLFPFIDHGTATAGLIIGSHALDPASTLSVPGMVLLKQSDGAEAKRGPVVLVPCRVSDSVILTEFEIPRVADAIRWAVDRDCKVVSISLGSEGIEDNRLEAAVRYAHDNGVIVCAAAGQYVPFMLWPASFARETNGSLCICCGPSTPQKKTVAMGAMVDLGARLRHHCRTSYRDAESHMG